MSPQDRRQVVPTLFLVGGVLFAINSVRDDAGLAVQLFSVAAGAVAAIYGALRLRAERRRPPSGPPDPDGSDRPPPA